MRAILLAGLFVASTILAGCTGGGATLTTDFITPGVWNVAGDTDHILAWVHNGGGSPVEAEWSLTAAGGAALPDDWEVEFSVASAELEKDGSKFQTPRGQYEYTDWGRTLITLRIPEDEPAGEHAIELHAGSAVREATLVIESDRTEVSGPGSQVTVDYEGRFTDDGEVFDAGQFPTELGSGQTVVGFDYGLMGLARGESAELVLPAAYGYGYDIPEGHRLEKFNGRGLTFDVTLRDLR